MLTKIAAATAHLPNVLMGCATVLIAYGLVAGIGQVGLVI